MSRGRSINRDAGSWYFVVDRAPAGALRRQVKRRGFRTKAQSSLTALLADGGRGTFVKPAKVTVDGYLDAWLDGLAVEGLRQSTLASYADNLRLHVRPLLGAGRLQHLQPMTSIASTPTLLAEAGRTARAVSRRGPCGTSTRW